MLCVCVWVSVRRCVGAHCAIRTHFRNRCITIFPYIRTDYECAQQVSAYTTFFLVLLILGVRSQRFFLHSLVDVFFFVCRCRYFARALIQLVRSVVRAEAKKVRICTDIIHHSRSVSRRSRIQKLSQYAVKRLLCVLFVFLSIKKIILSNLCIVFGGHKNSFFRYHFNVSKDQRREI